MQEGSALAVSILEDLKRLPEQDLCGFRIEIRVQGHNGCRTLNQALQLVLENNLLELETYLPHIEVQHIQPSEYFNEIKQVLNPKL